MRWHIGSSQAAGLRGKLGGDDARHCLLTVTRCVTVRIDRTPISLSQITPHENSLSLVGRAGEGGPKVANDRAPPSPRGVPHRARLGGSLPEGYWPLTRNHKNPTELASVARCLTATSRPIARAFQLQTRHARAHYVSTEDAEFLRLKQTIRFILSAS